MKTLYLDCGMGAAGDMLTAALLELVPDPAGFVKKLNDLGIPHVEFIPEKSEKCGIIGTHMTVLVHGHEEEDHHHHDHDHEHDHEHHHHHHSSMGDIAHIVSHMQIPASVAADVLAVYGLIAEAESHAHGVPVTEIHFHEVGSLDAIADVTAVCMLMHEIAPEQVIASPVHVGAGTVKCAHGILPVPAPATAYILQGVPTYGGSIMSELCTPTGAALLKHFVSKYGDMPVMQIEKTGCGMGRKDFPRANCVRAMLGTTEETLWVLSCNLDDMTGEEIGFALEQIEAAGADTTYTTAIGMKKSRPGVMLTAVCKTDAREAVADAFFRYTTTLGVRMHEETVVLRPNPKSET